jgi:hypothetical protein
VVGTLFAVEAEGGASRVSVAHGRVRVSAPSLSPLPSRGDRAHEYLREIASGQSWLTTQPDPGALAPSLEEALTDHARIAAPTGTAVPLAVAGAPIAADVWIDDRRVASAPAWMRVDARAMVRLSARGYQDAIWR